MIDKTLHNKEKQSNPLHAPNDGGALPVRPQNGPPALKTYTNKKKNPNFFIMYIDVRLLTVLHCVCITHTAQQTATTVVSCVWNTSSTQVKAAETETATTRNPATTMHDDTQITP